MYTLIRQQTQEYGADKRCSGKTEPEKYDLKVFSSPSSLLTNPLKNPLDISWKFGINIILALSM